MILKALFLNLLLLLQSLNLLLFHDGETNALVMDIFLIVLDHLREKDNHEAGILTDKKLMQSIVVCKPLNNEVSKLEITKSDNLEII